MNIKLKSILPSLSCLLIGMLFFFSIRALPFPLPQEWNNDINFGLISCVVMFLLSKTLLNYENIKLSTMHLIPNNKTMVHILIGLVVGTLITGTMIYILFTFTNLELQRVEIQTITPFFLASLVFIPLALMEELLFRGYPFFRLSQLTNIRWVILITAVLFTLYHFNGSSSIASLLLGPGVWGVTFGVAAYLSKSIAVPLGIHISANALQALFGLKDGYIPMWEIPHTTALSTITQANHLGHLMQVMLLILSLIILELSIFKKKSIRLKVAQIHPDLTNNTILKNK